MVAPSRAPSSSSAAMNPANSAPTPAGSSILAPNTSTQPQHDGASAIDATRNNGSSETTTVLSRGLWRRLYWFSSLLVLDGVSSVVLLLPLFHPIGQYENGPFSSQHYYYSYQLHASLWDLAFLALLRIMSAVLALGLTYHYYYYHPAAASLEQQRQDENDNIDNPHFYHPNGTRKTKDELEQQALEESCCTKVQRHFRRYACGCELVVLLTGILLSIKSMARLNVEIGVYGESRPEHPLFWGVLVLTGAWALLEGYYMESMERSVRDIAVLYYAQQNNQQRQRQSLNAEESNRLMEPLLQTSTRNANTIEHGSSIGDTTANGNNINSSIASAQQQQQQQQQRKPHGKKSLEELDYNSSWEDIVEFVLPDKHWIFLATLFLFAAAICNVYIPHFTGKILDALVSKNSGDDCPPFNATFIGNHTYDDNDDENRPDNHHGSSSILQIPGFVANIEKLVLVSVLGGVFAGMRGAIFSTVGARCNARLRIQLMDSLLCQDIGFYDTTRTGDITSRLSSDTTLVGSAVTNNVNVFLRSIVRAIGVLIFMCFISWQLTMLAFLTIPAVSILSKWYGRYVRRLSKAQQKKLAEGNNVSETVISSMATVRSFGAERIEMKEFETYMDNFLQFNLRSAFATFGYQTFVGALPQLVKALVLFYGGLLVQSERNPMTGGQLITFVLYLTTLAESFNSLGSIYASLSRAVGASEKVFALMHREPRRTTPSKEDDTASLARANDDLNDNNNNNINHGGPAIEGDLEQQEQHTLLSQQAVGNNRIRQNVPEATHTAGMKLWKMLLSHNDTKKQTRVIQTFTRGLYPTPEDLPSLRMGAEISFHSVEARYPSRPDRVVLDGLNLTIPAGSICALVGSSGSGKSSVVKLVQNLYEPTKGKVCINGIDVRQLSPEWLAKHVAAVSQEPVLFARSVRDNIVYGLEDGGVKDEIGASTNKTTVPDEEIMEAAKLANAHEFIERLPQGYNTEVGERGIQLSGGQRQRCAIARAIVRKPLLLLLDEATAALDSESEFVVQLAIDDIMSSQHQRAERSREHADDDHQEGHDQENTPMTVLMIAHRLSTVRNADIIFVVENGKVVEQGSHTDLIANNGVYKALVSRQMMHPD